MQFTVVLIRDIWVAQDLGDEEDPSVMERLYVATIPEADGPEHATQLAKVEVAQADTRDLKERDAPALGEDDLNVYPKPADYSMLVVFQGLPAISLFGFQPH